MNYLTSPHLPSKAIILLAKPSRAAQLLGGTEGFLDLSWCTTHFVSAKTQRQRGLEQALPWTENFSFA